jgi:hypothetical protein
MSIVTREVDVSAFAQLLSDEIENGTERSIEAARAAIRYLDIECAVNDAMDESYVGPYVKWEVVPGRVREGYLTAKLVGDGSVNVYVGESYLDNYVNCDGGDIPEMLDNWVFEDNPTVHLSNE